MGLKRYREKNFINNNIKKDLAQLDIELKQFIGCDFLGICPQPTGNNWQGVLSATIGLFGNQVFQIPQYYSNTVYNQRELYLLGDLLGKLDIGHFIFSGYLPYFDILIERIHAAGKKVSLIYHGSHTSVLEIPEVASQFNNIIRLKRSGILYHVGFVKKGMDKSFEVHTGLKFLPIHLITDESIFNLKANTYDGFNIGVLTHDSFRKNIYNMLSAALLVENSKVHMKSIFRGNYLTNSNRIVEHNTIADHKDFLKILGGMNINLYVTFSECWGQFVNESLALGVPCLTSDVSAVLDFDPEMKKRLVVKEFDNDFAIFMKIQELMEDLAWYKTNGPDYIRKLNIVARNNFLNFVA